MKTLDRGQFAHRLGMLLFVLLALPGLLLSLASRGDAAGGRQNYLLLPFNRTAESAPSDLATQLQSQFQLALIRPGTEVDVLTKNAKMLQLAKAQLDEAGQSDISKNYDLASDPSVAQSDRTKAAAYLLAHLGVDGIIYATVDGYEYAKSPKQIKVHVAATLVTLERDSTGTIIKDQQGFVVPSVIPFAAIGNSTVLPKNKQSNERMTTEAVSDAATVMVSSMNTAIVGGDDSAAQPVVKDKPAKKKSNKTWLWVLLGVVLIAAIASGSHGGNHKDNNPVTPTTPTAIFQSYNVTANDQQDLVLNVSWKLSSTATPTNVAIYRGVQTSAVAQTSAKTKLAGSKDLDATPVYNDIIDNSTVKLNGSMLTYTDNDILVDGNYSYKLIVTYENNSTAASDETTPKTLSTIDNLIYGQSGVSDKVKVDLSWNSRLPKTGWDSTKFTVYRSTSSTLSTRQFISYDELSKYSCKKITELDWIASQSSYSIVDSSLPSSAVARYIIVASNGSTPIAGPYRVYPVTLQSTNFTGQIAQYTISTDASSASLYYSADPDYRLSDSANRTTNITITGTDLNGQPAAGARVRITTNKGSFIPVNDQYVENTTTNGLNQIVTGLLDSNGQMTLLYTGWADNDTHVDMTPIVTDLGRPTFTLACNQTTKTLQYSTTSVGDTFPMLVGPPNSIVMANNFSDAAARPDVQQNEPNALFQDKRLTLTATVKDINGSPVLLGTPIWFTQSWSHLTSGAGEGTDSYFNQAYGPGSYDNVIVYTDSNGQAKSTFQSNHSGKYTLKAFPIKSLSQAQKNTLISITNDIDGGLSDLSSIRGMLSDGSGMLYGSTAVLTKTYVKPGTWKQLNAPTTPPRLYCNGEDSTTVSFTAYDKDGKRILPGVFYAVRPYRLTVTSVRKSTGIASSTKADDFNGHNVFFFGDSGVASFSIAGDFKIGKILLEFNTLKDVASNGTVYTRDIYDCYKTPVAVMYWMPLSKAIDDIMSSAYKAIDIPHAGDYNTEIPWLVGSAETNDQQKKQLEVTIRLQDQETNKFPEGYQIIVTSREHGISWLGETDSTGVFKFTYNTWNISSFTSDDLLVQITGENEDGTLDVRSDEDAYNSPINAGNPFVSNTIINSEALNFVKFDAGTDVTIAGDRTFNFNLTGYCDDAHRVMQGYPITITYDKSTGCDAETGATTGTLELGGRFYDISVKPKTKSGTVWITVKYRCGRGLITLGTLTVHVIGSAG